MQHVRMTEASCVREASSSSTAKASRQAIHQILVPFSVAYFAGAFATDVAYWPPIPCCPRCSNICCRRSGLRKQTVEVMRHLHRRLRGGADRVARQGRSNETKIAPRGTNSN